MSLNRSFPLVCLAALASSAAFAGCGNKDERSEIDVDATGGRSTGGYYTYGGGIGYGATGGTATGGRPPTGGRTSTGGGAQTGGSTSTGGGENAGEAGTAGALTAGTGNIGIAGAAGVATGETGGTASAGVAGMAGALTGGTSAGGSETGGVATGGTETGGVATGGTGTGGTSGSGGAAAGGTGGGCSDLVADENNCGSCGHTCGASEYCVDGACAACDNRVLFLGDSSTSANQVLAAAMTALGLAPTMGSSAAYAGVPDAAEFGAVYISPTFGIDMPQGGQDSILAATPGGTGVVFLEYAAYMTTRNGGSHYQTLEPLMLLSSEGNPSGVMTFTLGGASHPIWNDLPSSFQTSLITNITSGQVINGGTQIASVSGTPGTFPGVVVKAGAARTVHVNHAGSFYLSTWVNDANLLRMTVNSVIWAAGCY